MKKKALFLAALTTIAGAWAFAADVDVGIRFFNKQVYYTDNAPVYVQVTVTNNSSDVYRFRMADDRAFSLDFDVRSMQNRQVESADALLRRRSSSAQVFFRDIAVDSGESFSFIEDLRDWVTLDTPGAYVVQARLYPELYKSQAVLAAAGAGPARNGDGRQTLAAAKTLASARLNLNLRAPLLAAGDGVPQALELATDAILVRERLPPDEVVAFMLTARQRAQWEKFFLYFDLERMLTRDAARQRRWRAESEEGRQRMLERFRGDLQNAVIDGDIAAIPTRFNIERTVYNAEEGTVVVTEWFKQGGYSEKKRYTYYLRRADDVWTVYDYVVVNMGAE